MTFMCSVAIDINELLHTLYNRISRGESQQPSSNVHFFTSQFMTTLKEKGPRAVASWTGKKHINLFQKKLVFIPVNADLHWLLCVVVNPGLIANNLDCDFDTGAKNMHCKCRPHLFSWVFFVCYICISSYSQLFS